MIPTLHFCNEPYIFYSSYLHLQFYKQCNMGTPPAAYDRGRDWNVDLIPKFLMANG